MILSHIDGGAQAVIAEPESRCGHIAPRGGSQVEDSSAPPLAIRSAVAAPRHDPIGPCPTRPETSPAHRPRGRA